jgi:hypothetical protein
MFSYTNTATGPSDNTLSLGGTLSWNASAGLPYTIPSGVMDNIFDDVTGDESAVGKTEYRAIAVYIGTIFSPGSFDAITPRIWISGYYRAPSDADTIYISATTFPLNSNTMKLITSETEDPAAPPSDIPSFGWLPEDTPATIWWDSSGNPTTVPQVSGASTLKSGNWCGIWLKRVVPAGARAWNNRSVTITFQCETTASPYKYLVERNFVYNWQTGAIQIV